MIENLVLGLIAGLTGASVTGLIWLAYVITTQQERQ